MPGRLVLFGLAPGRPRPDIVLSGSPERCAARAAVEDADGRVFVLERLSPGQADRRRRIARALAGLHARSLPVAPYRPAPGGDFAPEADGAHWQLAPYVPGDPLPRPNYVDHVRRGESLGRFLADLHAAAPAVHDFDREPGFDLEHYADGLMAAIRARHPRLHAALAPVPPVLAPLFEAWPHLPASLCQGDFHPLNVLWRGQSVAAVIDWEFAGVRPALFDAANCLGCVGIEDPAALVKGLAPALLRALRDSGRLDPENFALLPETLLALRFAWLSEWLRRGDGEMIDLETRYMRLLANSLDTLLPAWKRIAGL
ncbi:MAG: phosphotransferase [Pseudodesulfovibrio sp.]